MTEQDVPSPIDLKNPMDAREWERAAQSRPGRLEMFRAFSNELRKIKKPELDVLELGSGPGFLAAYLLQEIPNIRMTLLDFSAAMHDLARNRLGTGAGGIRFVERSFKEPGWEQGLGVFDAVITNQAVHELRHKKYAVSLHSIVRCLLKSNGVYLVCDHFFGDGGLKNDQLYMTVSEQQEALKKSGFSSVRQVASSGSLVMHYAT